MISKANADLISDIRKHGIRVQGRKELIAHLEGKRLTRNQAIKAGCYGCMGWFADGAGDCQQAICPLHPFMPYHTRQASTGKNGQVPDRLDDGIPGNTEKAHR